jgi:argininosuccinate synthase
MTVDFEAGAPTALNGTPMDLPDLIGHIGKQAGACGVGRIDHVESRVVGIKSREIYECPAALTILQAHKALEAMVLTREEIAFKAKADAAWADLVYEGKWHAPLRKELDAFINATQSRVTGSVRMKLYKGSLAVVGRKSAFSLYDRNLATYGADDPFDHGASQGFSKIACIEAATLAGIGSKKSKNSEVEDHDEIDMAETVSA